ncbi:MAG TPA: response regulator transcription factor [Candidatus Sulfotelmatobacter sp.]|jgi:FixJ family two-component response regulator|nr:response regulator transcription factor [Candidatus Sulfotelmatobacter sp.]
MTDVSPLVLVVDDDPALRDSIAFLVTSVGYDCRCFASAEEFLGDWRDDRPACLVADVRMPGMSGLELQKRLAESKSGLGVIFVTGHGDVPMAVRAMRGGAIDFLQKPFNDQLLLDRVREALAHSAATRATAAERALVETRLARLTARERDVLRQVVAGKANKQIAADLDISIKTVEVHRHNVMDKMEAASVAELARSVGDRL